MELLILGAGGIGGYLTSRMQQAGFSPRLLVRPNRADQLRQTGLRLTSPLGDWAGMPIIESDPSALPKADFIFLTCKSYDLETALDAIAAAVNEKTIIVPFLNGVRHIEIIKARLPHAIIWGGVAHLGVRVEPDGSICHFNDLNKFLIGPVDVSSSDERARVLVERLAEGPTEFTYKENIQQDMWDKLVFLSALAGMTCLMRADIGTILATNQGEDPNPTITRRGLLYRRGGRPYHHSRCHESLSGPVIRPKLSIHCFNAKRHDQRQADRGRQYPWRYVRAGSAARPTCTPTPDMPVTFASL